jgi:hypothetical protein
MNHVTYASLIPRQLSTTRMWIFARRIEPVLDVLIQRSHDADAHHHRRAIMFDDQEGVIAPGPPRFMPGGPMNAAVTNFLLLPSCQWGVQICEGPQISEQDGMMFVMPSFRISCLGAYMGEVVQFVPKSELDRARLIREARAIYERIFPPADPVNEQLDPKE